MLNLLIAEDDELERNGLISSINWEGLGITIAGCAEDGEQALEMAREIKPDILITDIRMPLMDGIELAGIIKKDYPDTKIIFISGFDDFNYALAAIKFNISDYILKPYNTDLEKVESSLKKVAYECLSEKRKKREERILQETINEYKPIFEDKFFRDIILGFEKNEGRIENKVSFFGIRKLAPAFLVVLIQIDEQNDILKNKTELESQLLKISLIEIFKEYLCKYYFFKIFSSHDNEFVIILNDNESTLKKENEIEMILERMKNAIAMEYDMALTIGISNMEYKLTDMSRCYNEALEAIRHKFYLGRDKVIFYNDIKFAKNTVFPDVDEIIRNIIFSVKVGNQEDIYIKLDGLFEEYSQSAGINCKYIQNIAAGMVLQAIKVLMELDLNVNSFFAEELMPLNQLMVLETIPDIKSWLKSTFKNMVDIINDNNTKRMTNITTTVKRIIQEKYMKDLLIEDIANEVFLSPNYLNTIFKKNSGKSINKYLIEIRMSKAMEMLNKPDATIYKVSESVGYKNIAHFSTLFKKYTNMTPMEYREKKYIQDTEVT
jgi:AraC-type DNA-binding domain-containing proteins